LVRFNNPLNGQENTSVSEVKTKLLELIDQTYQALIESLHTHQQPPPTEGQNPEAWSPKDILAHVTTWEEVLIRFHLTGEEFSSVVGMDEVRYRETPFDEINHHLNERFRDRSFEEVMDYAHQTHAQLLQQLRQVEEKELLAPAAALEAQGYPAEPLLSYVAAITYEHYAEHRQQMDQLRD
jgi:hypothetical protein